MAALSTLLTSLGVGAGAGLNSYATLLVLGLFARLKPEWFHDDVARFFSMTPVLVILGVLYLVEFFADKIPAVDHVWDVLHTFIRPLAGAVAAVGAAHGTSRGVVVLAALLAGGVALSTHTVKASTRVASSVMTAGTASPLLSVMEDLLAFVATAATLLLPWLAIVVLICVLFIAINLRRRFSKSAGRQFT